VRLRLDLHGGGAMTKPQLNIPLRACPFCGSKNVTVNYHNYSKTDWWVFCLDCDGSGPIDLGESGACETWNTRPLEAQLLEALRGMCTVYELWDTTPPDYFIGAYNKAQAAIAAAEGATPPPPGEDVPMGE